MGNRGKKSETVSPHLADASSLGLGFDTGIIQIDENSKIGLAPSLDSSQQAVMEASDLIQVTIDEKRWRYQVTSEDLENAFAHFTLNTDLRIPNQNQLLQNYPNLFNPETWIPFPFIM